MGFVDAVASAGPMQTICTSLQTDNHTNTTPQLNRELRTQVSNTSKSASLMYTIINKQYHFMTSSDQFRCMSDRL